ncbi:MAG: DUF3299 domain-containing protein [Candidatus Hydrogenedentes bacterium]|nr:DUF3299 domain-containing protein [Candidatus Hydrogenedentota bacterium]
MRTRVVRDLGTIAGIVVILAGIVGLNMYYRLDGLKQRYDRIRRVAEAERVKSGMDILNWDLLRETKGNLRSGAQFSDGLVTRAKEGRTINLMGFMTPIDQFKDVAHFMLLPLPIECYFCRMPPMRDVILVRMNEGEITDIVTEPVLVSGELQLHEGPKQKFFYSVQNATLQSGKSGAKLTKRTFSQRHREESRTLGGDLLDDAHGESNVPQEEMMPPVQSAPAPTPPPGPQASASP